MAKQVSKQEVTQESKYDRAIRWLKRGLEDVLESANEARLDVARRMSESSHEAMYAMEWLESSSEKIAAGACVEKINAMLARRAPETPENEHLYQVISSVARDLEEKLLRNSFRDGSTSAFSNATARADRVATTRMYERLSSAIEVMDEERSKDLAEK